jgi:hypothetical protein
MYVWSRSRRISERSWNERDGKFVVGYVYMYYPTGELHEYSVHKHTPKGSPDHPYEWFVEYFDKAGNLKAVGYSRHKPRTQDVHAFYRNGAPIDVGDFKRAEFNLKR